MNTAKPIIIVSGATATGKTSTSIDLALNLSKLQYPCEIINFDSLLFYKELTIGTAKPTTAQRKGVKHWLLDIRSISDPLNAADYFSLCINKIDELHQAGMTPILVGGSAFYLRAIVKGMYESVTIEDTIKQKVQSLYESQGIESIRAELQKVDSPSFEQLHPNDHYRIIRAYEHFLATGDPISLEKNKKNDPYDLSDCHRGDWSFHHIYLHVPKLQHWDIILQRTKDMISDGLVPEVEALLKQGYDPQCKPLQSIGHKETIQYLSGSLTSLDELIEKIYFSTRRLAKSQKTFFKKLRPKNQYHPLEQREELMAQAKKFLESFNYPR